MACIRLKKTFYPTEGVKCAVGSLNADGVTLWQWQRCSFQAKNSCCGRTKTCRCELFPITENGDDDDNDDGEDDDDDGEDDDDDNDKGDDDYDIISFNVQHFWL